MGFLCRDKVFLRHNRVWPKQGILGRDIIFSCQDQVWGKGQEILCRDREFDVVTELSMLVSLQSMLEQKVPGHRVSMSRQWGKALHRNKVVCM